MRSSIITFGLYSALRACNAMVFKSKRTSKFTVATMFLIENKEVGEDDKKDSYCIRNAKAHLLQRWYNSMHGAQALFQARRSFLAIHCANVAIGSFQIIG